MVLGGTNVLTGEGKMLVTNVGDYDPFENLDELEEF